jgi:hypothetical protein
MNQSLIVLIARLAGQIEFASESSVAPDKRTGWQAEIAHALSSLEADDRATLAMYVRGAAEDAEDERWRDWFLNFPRDFGLLDETGSENFS